MTDQLISFETAKLAKEKGFCEKVYYFYNEDDETEKQLYTYKRFMILNDEELKIEAPTQSLLQKWLREVHNCIVEVQFEKLPCLNQLDWIVTVDYYKPDFSNLTEESDYESDYFSTYEEALEDGLYNALKLI